MASRAILSILACVLLLVAIAPPVPAAEEETDRESASLEKALGELRQQRVEAAQQAVEAVQAAFNAQTVTLDVLLDAINKLAEAQLAVAKTRDQRIDALERRLKRLQGLEHKIAVLYQIGTKGGEAKELAMAKRERLSAQIAFVEALLQEKD